MLANALVDTERSGALARHRLRDERLNAPELIDIEVLSTLRRGVLSGRIGQPQAARALIRLNRMPLRRHSHRSLAHRCWDLRDNLTPYDAAYVALAERLGEVLVTSDGRVARAPGLRCSVELLSVS